MKKYAVNEKEHYQKLDSCKAESTNDSANLEKPVNIVEINPIVIINDECAICFNEIYSNDEYLIFSECEHSYHLPCLNRWKCVCNSSSTVYKCELCQKYRDIKEFNQNKVEIIKVKNPRRTNWFKKCIKKLFG